jgi:hypothetical protein
MMQTTLFYLCADNTAVKNLLGTAPVRLYPFGTAPQKVVKPYSVYQTISGSPENLLSGAPDIDGIMQQVDVYATTAGQATSVAAAIRAAIELNCYVTGFRDWPKDQETGNYRYTLTLDWLIAR